MPSLSPVDTVREVGVVRQAEGEDRHQPHGCPVAFYQVTHQLPPDEDGGDARLPPPPGRSLGHISTLIVFKGFVVHYNSQSITILPPRISQHCNVIFILTALIPLITLVMMLLLRVQCVRPSEKC